MSKEKTNVKPVELEIGDKVYTLDFTRNSIKYAEQHGFAMREDFGEKPVSDMTNLFYFSFRANHPEVTEEESDEIFEMLKGQAMPVITRLAELYAAQYVSLFGDESDGEAKNSNVKVRL